MPNSNSKRKISQNTVILGWVSFFNDFASEMIYPLFPVFVVSVLGAGPAALGLIEGIAESVSSVFKVYSGWLSDRLKKRKMLVVTGYFLSNTVRPLMGFCVTWPQVLFLRFADRGGKGIRTSPRDALIAADTDRQNRGKAFGFQRSLDHFGAVAGSLTATVLLLWFFSDVRIIFWLSIIPGVIAVSLVFIGVKEKPVKEMDSAPDLWNSWRELPRNFKAYLMVIFIFTLGNSTDAFLLLRARDMGIGIAFMPLIWVWLHLIKTAFSFPGGILSDHLGRQKVIVLGWIIYCCVYIAFSYLDSVASAWILFAFYGLYFGFTEGAERALVADLVPSHLAGAAYGFFHFVMGVALLPASILFGLIWHTVGSGWAFRTGAGLALISVFLLLILNPAGANKKKDLH